MDDINTNIEEEFGAVRITDDVVSVIAGLAAVEIPGVASMSGGFAGGIAEALGMKSLSKGVKVEVDEKEAIINLFIIVNYGARIPEVAWNIQENVKKSVENMTGLIVNEVNIHVQGINIPKSITDDEDNEDIEELDVEDELLEIEQDIDTEIEKSNE